MPLPLLIGGAILLAGVGVKKGVDASETNKRAERIIRISKREFAEAKELLDEEQSDTNHSLQELGQLKVELFTTDIKLLIKIIKKYKSQANSRFTDKKFITENDLVELKQSLSNSLEIKKGVASGAAAGALTGLGAYGAVGALASASTGTAIAGLSGVAASNATLAWLGGGSLAAGGGGMAMGTAVLGGLVAGPLIAVGGLVMNSKAEKNLTEAREFEEEADIAIEQMEAAKVVLYGIRERVSELDSTLIKVSTRFNLAASKLVDLNVGLLTRIFRKIFSKKDVELERKINECLILGKALKNILDIAVLNEEGKENIQMRSQIQDVIILEG